MNKDSTYKLMGCGVQARTIAGYEAVHMIRKGQAKWVNDHDVRQQNRFIDRLFNLAA